MFTYEQVLEQTLAQAYIDNLKLSYELESALEILREEDEEIPGPEVTD